MVVISRVLSLLLQFLQFVLTNHTYTIYFLSSVHIIMHLFIFQKGDIGTMPLPLVGVSLSTSRKWSWTTKNWGLARHT